MTPRPESRALGEDFVSNLASRLGRFGDRTLVTDKQVEILRRIERKLGSFETGAGRPPQDEGWS